MLNFDLVRTLAFKIILQIIFFLQKAILFTAFQFYKRINSDIRYSWVVGVDEIAGMNRNISKAISNSYSINMSSNIYYDFEYDYSLKIKGKMGMIIRLLISPIILAKLINQTNGFIYLWSTRYLLSRFDQGEYEYKFLKKQGKKIVFYFVGSEIRSARVCMALARENNYECMSDYQNLLQPSISAHKHEEILKKRCNIAEKYGDLIITASVDQASYFKKKTYPFLYFYPNHLVSHNTFKFDNIKTIRIVHAPSSPFIKGTPLVRAAVLRLKREGHKFDYIELHGAKNTEVMYQLKYAHIVMNEFYAHVPGVFGVEAMANYCALMTSADETIEPDLPSGSNQAWLVTKSYEVYDNLKILLENPEIQKRYADAGYRWVNKYATDAVCNKKFHKKLLSLTSK